VRARVFERVDGHSRLAWRIPALPGPGPGGDAAFIALDSGSFLRLQRGAGVTVGAVAGMLWVTRDGSPDDVLLNPGQEFYLFDDTPLLISAFKPSVVRVAAGARRGAGWLRFAKGMLGRWRLASTGA